MRWLLCLYLIALFTGCQTLQPAPRQQFPIANIWAGKIYLGDSKRLGVAQSSVSPVIACGSSEFDRIVCMTVEDYTVLMQYFIQAACVNQ